MDGSHYFKYHIRHCIQDAINKNRDPHPVEFEYLETFSVDAYSQLITEYEDRGKCSPRSNLNSIGGDQKKNEY